MISRTAARRARVPEPQPWTEPALLVQMNVLQTLVQSVPVDVKHLSAQCLLMSKILDALVANHRKPLWRQDLLQIIKQVCKHKENPDLRASLLILLLSVKNAYREDWLSPGTVTERDEVFTTLKQLFDFFTTAHEVSGNAAVQLLLAGGSAVADTQEARVYLDRISSRFYPRLQVNSVFVAVQAKVGYEVLMCDFHVQYMHPQDRVRLYVGQKDSTETSMCIITPPQVNILVNGQQVERRVTTGYLDAGAQMPSDVTTLVKMGANVLQIIGEFSVSYIIAVTSSRTIHRSASSTELLEYVVPTKAADSTEVDDEVVEGASRVTLRCPISHQRLVTPVKASTCRHLQCFDYDSFLEINEKRPAWRCPCCNRFTSCPDLRIDRQMEKVLKETDEKVHEVTFNQDGSWVPVSTEENGPCLDVTSIEGNEKGRKFIDLSDNDEEEPVIGKRQNHDVFQQTERKPDAQTLQAVAGTRGIFSQPSNLLVQQLDTAGRPITTVAPESARRVGVSRNDATFVNVNGGVSYTPMPRTVEMQVQNQSPPSVQSLSAVNHNIQVTFPQSRPASHLSPATRSAPVRGYVPSDQLQQSPTGGPSQTAPVNQGETRWVRQRQAGQQSAGTSQHVNQNVQDLGQTRPQWRTTGVPQQQLGTNTAQPQSGQQFYANQSTVSNSPRQYHPSAGVNSRQHPNSQRSLQQVPQQPSPGVNAQQRPGNWGGGQPAGQRRSSSSSPSPSSNQAQVRGNPGASEQNWQPVQRMRGSVANSPLGRGVQLPAPQQQGQVRMAVSPSGNTFPFNTPTTNVGAPISFSNSGMDPVIVVTNPAANVALFNGTNWVNGAEFSSAPLVFGTAVQTPDRWVSFENQNSGTPPGHPPH